MEKEWKFLRKTLAHSFTTTKVRLLSTVFNNSTDTCMNILNELHKTGKEFDIKRSVRYPLLYQNIWRTCYSYFS